MNAASPSGVLFFRHGDTKKIANFFKLSVRRSFGRQLCEQHTIRFYRRERWAGR
jgi:hypothetical protein